MKTVPAADDNLLVDISDALSERDRVRFTVHTKSKLPQFSKPTMSVVRQHEEFIWLHDCLNENEQYAGYIIPPAPPRPDFSSSREKLERLGDSESGMTKEEFAKMKQELEAEYLALFKKTVAMHEIFLQRLAAHEKFRYDHNFKIFLEYENELSVRNKSARERLAGSLQNIGKSLTDFVITTSQVAATTSVGSGTIITNNAPSRFHRSGCPTSPSSTSIRQSQPSEQKQQQEDNLLNNQSNIHNTSDVSSRETCNHQVASSSENAPTSLSINNANSSNQLQQQAQQQETGGDTNNNNDNNLNNGDTAQHLNNAGDVAHQDADIDDIDEQYFEKERLFLALYHNSIREAASQADKVTQMQRCVADSYLNMSQNFVKLASVEPNPIPCILKLSDYFEQARKIEGRIASDEDLKLTDTFLYTKRETVAAQDLLMRRLRFMAEYETATRNLDKARQKGRTQMQYAEVIKKQAKENFVNISKLAKQELGDYKQRRVAAFKKAFADLADLELKHLRTNCQLIADCIHLCNGNYSEVQGAKTKLELQSQQPQTQLIQQSSSQHIQPQQQLPQSSSQQSMQTNNQL